MALSGEAVLLCVCVRCINIIITMMILYYYCYDHDCYYYWIRSIIYWFGILQFFSHYDTEKLMTMFEHVRCSFFVLILQSWMIFRFTCGLYIYVTGISQMYSPFNILFVNIIFFIKSIGFQWTVSSELDYWKLPDRLESQFCLFFTFLECDCNFHFHFTWKSSIFQCWFSHFTLEKD